MCDPGVEQCCYEAPQEILPFTRVAAGRHASLNGEVSHIYNVVWTLAIGSLTVKLRLSLYAVWKFLPLFLSRTYDTKLTDFCNTLDHVHQSSYP